MDASGQIRSIVPARSRYPRGFRYALARAPRCACRGEPPGEASGHGGGDPPGPIPNPEVKPSIADGTAAQGRGRAGRCWPHRRVLGGKPGTARGGRAPCPSPSSSLCARFGRGGCGPARSGLRMHGSAFLTAVAGHLSQARGRGSHHLRWDSRCSRRAASSEMPGGSLLTYLAWNGGAFHCCAFVLWVADPRCESIGG